MKHARSDYNARFQDAANIVPDMEPVFLIRGQDVVGHMAVRAWAMMHQRNGGQDAAYIAAMRHADLMEAWAAKHGKLADLPPEVANEVMAQPVVEMFTSGEDRVAKGKG